MSFTHVTPWKSPPKRKKAKKRRTLTAEEKLLRKERREADSTIRTMQKQWAKKYASNPKNRLRLLFYQIRHRAQKVGHEFDPLVADKFIESPPIHCACCHTELDYSAGRGHADRDNSPSIDRVRNSHGYTLDNVAVVCWLCNRRKSDSSVSELKEIIRYMEAHQKKDQ